MTLRLCLMHRRLVRISKMKFSLEKFTLVCFTAAFTYFVATMKSCNHTHGGYKQDNKANFATDEGSSPYKPVIAEDNGKTKWCFGSLRYLDPPGPLTALASYPGSGNTWVRYLLQQATGIVTGSVYNATHLKESCFPGEGHYDGNVLAIKTHVGRKTPPNPKWPTRYDRVVVIVRDPFDAFLAEFNRQHSKNHTGFAPEEKFETDWPPYVTNSMEYWKGFHVYFSTQYEPHQLLFARYEELRDNLMHELQRILHFLGYNMTDDIRECVKQQKEGLYHRKKLATVDQQKYYNAEQVIVLKNIREFVYKKIGLEKSNKMVQE